MRESKCATQVMLVLLASICAHSAFAQSAEQTYALEKEVLMDTERCVVVRLALTAGPEEDANNTRLEWDFRPGGPDTMSEFSASMANGAFPPEGKPTRVEIVFVAQVAPASKKHPPMLQFSNKQKSHYSEGEGATSSEWHRLDHDLTASDVFHIDIESGTHPLQEEIVVGELAGQPIVLFFGSDPAYKARLLDRTSSNDSNPPDDTQDETDQKAAAG
jgi:hypothetical protein